MNDKVFYLLLFLPDSHFRADDALSKSSKCHSGKNVDTEKFYSQRAFFTKNSTISSKEIPTCLAIFGTKEVSVKPG